MWKRKASPVGGFECHLEILLKADFDLPIYQCDWCVEFDWSSSQKQSCDDDTVVLRDVHADMSGYYTCEVSQKSLKLRGRTSSYWSKCLKNRELRNEAIESNRHCINRWQQLVCMRRFRKSNIFLLYVSVFNISLYVSVSNIFWCVRASNIFLFVSVSNIFCNQIFSIVYLWLVF